MKKLLSDTTQKFGKRRKKIKPQSSSWRNNKKLEQKLKKQKQNIQYFKTCLRASLLRI